MEVRTALEHLNLIPVEKDQVSEELIKDLTKEDPILLVCDLSEGIDPDDRVEYAKALADADIIGKDLVEPIMDEDSLVIIVPFQTMQIASEVYRKIKHATHFVTMYVDGELQVGC